jgi:hypothetical protein
MLFSIRQFYAKKNPRLALPRVFLTSALFYTKLKRLWQSTKGDNAQKDDNAAKNANYQIA